MFARIHHQAIAQVMNALDADLLRQHQCYFGGGTAMAMRFGEYRESLDMDFLVSSRQRYGELRQLASAGLKALCKTGTPAFSQLREVRADRYGIRTMLEVVGRQIKFEIILESRIELDEPSAEDRICGISTLTPLDMATSKLLANSDRWKDDGAFNRDLIDLALMQASTALMKCAVSKAESAYGQAIQQDLEKAIDRIQNREGWLERCMQAMSIELPKALVWKHIRALRKILQA